MQLSSSDQLSLCAARAKSTCDTCVAKKKRQRENKQRNNRDKTDNLHRENRQFTGVIANQQEEIERLRSALNVLREGPARVSSQVLNQLHVDPSDTAAISTLLDSRAPAPNGEHREHVPCSLSHEAAVQGRDFRAEVVAHAMNTAGEHVAAFSTCSPSDSGKRIHMDSDSNSSCRNNLEHSKRQKATIINSLVQDDSTYPESDLDPAIFEVPWLDPPNDSSAGTGSGSGVGDCKDEQPSEDSTQENARPTEDPHVRSAFQKILFGPDKSSPLQQPAVMISALVLTISHYMLHIGDLSPQLESLSMLIATQQFSTTIYCKFAALSGCILAASACIRPPAWLDAFFTSLSLNQEGLLLEHVASAQRALFAFVVLVFCTKPIWLDTEFDMWLDPSVAPLVLKTVVIPGVTIGFMYTWSCWMVWNHSHVIMLNSITQFRRVMLLMMAPMAAASTNSDPLLRFLFSNCILHISYVQHLLDSFWILLWIIACWPEGEELMWLVSAVFGSFVCLAAKMICIQKFYHPEDRLGSPEVGRPIYELD